MYTLIQVAVKNLSVCHIADGNNVDDNETDVGSTLPLDSGSHADMFVRLKDPMHGSMLCKKESECLWQGADYSILHCSKIVPIILTYVAY